MKSFELLSNFFQFYVKKSKEKYHKNMSDYVEVENLPKANELINDDFVLINQNEDDAKVDMGTIKEFVRPPNASSTESGLVSTAEQTFSGKKNFTEIASNKAAISSLNSSNATLTEATVQDLHITGNLIQDGETIETEIETLKVKDQVIVTRSGATTGMTDGEVTGIVAEKYDGQNNGVLVFGSDGIARVGDEGDAQPLATREETPNNGSIQVWDEQTQSLKSFPFGQKGQYLRQGENGLEYGSAVAVDETASEEYVDNKVQEEATLRQNAIEELDAKKAEISDTTFSTTSTWSSSKIASEIDSIYLTKNIPAGGENKKNFSFRIRKNYLEAYYAKRTFLLSANIYSLGFSKPVIGLVEIFRTSAENYSGYVVNLQDTRYTGVTVTVNGGYLDIDVTFNSYESSGCMVSCSSLSNVPIA